MITQAMIEAASKVLADLKRERDEALERSRDYPTISARLHDREKAREAEQAACADALARVRDLEERIAELEAKAAEALEKFTGHYEPWMDRWADDAESSTFSRHTFGQLRSARAIISQIRSKK